MRSEVQISLSFTKNNPLLGPRHNTSYSTSSLSFLHFHSSHSIVTFFSSPNFHAFCCLSLLQTHTQLRNRKQALIIFVSLASTPQLRGTPSAWTFSEYLIKICKLIIIIFKIFYCIEAINTNYSKIITKF